VFLRKPEVVSVVRALAEYGSVADALTACGIEERRWPSFVKALDALAASNVIEERDHD